MGDNMRHLSEYIDFYDMSGRVQHEGKIVEQHKSKFRSDKNNILRSRESIRFVSKAIGQNDIMSTLTTINRFGIYDVEDTGNVYSVKPEEFGKLMHFPKSTIDILGKNFSPTQQYKMYGNSIHIEFVKYIVDKYLPKDNFTYFELCAGIGAFSHHLKDKTLVGYSELDKQTAKAFNLLHGGTNIPDMKTINVLNCTVLIGGTPCTKFSTLGDRTGGKKGSDSPSALLHVQSEIAIRNKIPIVIWENVENALNFEEVGEYIKDLQDAGYKHEVIKMDPTMFGVPMRRERVFVISKL